jgi:integrase
MPHERDAPKMHLIFQDAVLRGLKAPEHGQLDYTDAHTPGLTLRVGKRTKTFMYVRHSRGRRERITIGQFPTVSLGKAREEARKLAAQKTLGLIAPKAELLFPEAIEEFLSGYRRKNRATTTAATDRLLRKYFAFTGDVSSITAREIARAIEAIRAPSERHHAFVAARTFFNWLTKRRLIAFSPLGGTDAPRKSNPRERVLSDAELVAVWNSAPSNGYGAIIRLAIITGQRMGQLAGLRGEFLGSHTISWPPEAMKANRRHMIPLTQMAAGILDPYRREGLLFTTSDGHPFVAWGWTKERLDKVAGVSGWVHHDLRRTWATKAAEWGIAAPHIIERVLAHQGGIISGVAAIYNRATYMPEMREAMEEWERRLVLLLQGE